MNDKLVHGPDILATISAKLEELVLRRHGIIGLGRGVEPVVFEDLRR